MGAGARGGSPARVRRLRARARCYAGAVHVSFLEDAPWAQLAAEDDEFDEDEFDEEFDEGALDEDAPLAPEDPELGPGDEPALDLPAGEASHGEPELGDIEDSYEDGPGVDDDDDDDGDDDENSEPTGRFLI